MSQSFPPPGEPTPAAPPKRNPTIIIISAIIAVCLLLTLCVSVLGIGGVFLTQQGALNNLLNPGSDSGAGQQARPAAQATRPATQPGGQTRPGQNPPAQGQPQAPAQGNAVPASPDTLRLPGGDPPTLDPALTQDSTSANYIVEIFSGLVTLDRQGNIKPDIAKDWTVSQDGKTYSFNLRDDVKFHDGKPVTAQDFKYSIERACDPKTGSVVADTYLGDIVGCREKLTGKAKEVAGVKVNGDHALQISIDAPKQYFLAKLTYPTAFVVDQKNVESGGKNWFMKPNGTGPFKLSQYDIGQQMVLNASDNYYGDPKPKLKTINFMLAGGSGLVMYENGELDVVGVGANDIERVTDKNDPLNAELKQGDDLSTSYVAFNVQKPPFDDPKVRQAFALALDKQKLVDVVLKNTAKNAVGIVPPSMPGYQNPNLKTPGFDPEQAKKLLQESKYAGNLPDITLNISSAGGGAPSDFVQAMVQMWKDNLGVDVKIEQTEFATFLQDVSRKPNPYQMYSLAWIADYPDAQNFLDILFNSKSQDNHMSYGNPDVDKLLAQAAIEPDKAKRLAEYQQAEQKIMNDLPWIPLLHGQSQVLVKPYVKGYELSPLIVPIYKYVSIQK
ncbi:MAG: ABC transporter substrate-binding protein [Anaerolineae bacterium]